MQEPYIEHHQDGSLVLHTTDDKLHYLSIAESFLYNLGVITPQVLNLVALDKHDDSLIY